MRLAGKEKIIHSYGYPLPRREEGVTRDDGNGTWWAISRLTDGRSGDILERSNPYLTGSFNRPPTMPRIRNG